MPTTLGTLCTQEPLQICMTRVPKPYLYSFLVEMHRSFAAEADLDLGGYIGILVIFLVHYSHFCCGTYSFF
jgi:hypothetical protein